MRRTIADCRLHSAYPRISALLNAAGHDPAKAAEILLDAKRRDTHARAWIGALFKFRWAA
jgi:hypothetical protein